MSSEWELDEGIKSIKSAWRREHTARANLEKMLQQAESENAKLRELCKTLYQLADESYVPFDSVNRWMDDFEKAICAMRELRIEVDA